MIAEMNGEKFSFKSYVDFLFGVELNEWVSRFPKGGKIEFKSDDGELLKTIEVGKGKDHGDQTRAFFKSQGLSTNLRLV